jgi:alanine racemase
MTFATEASPPSWPTRAEISLGAIRHNVALLRDMAGAATIMAVIKADAYGHGAERIGPFLESLHVDCFAVATLSEAQALRAAGIRGRILVFAPPVEAELPFFADLDLDVNVTSLEIATLLSEHRFSGRVHLKVDTGMARVGVAPEEVERALDVLARTPALKTEALWTHLATADEVDSDFVAIQIDRFEEAIAPFRDAAPFTHVANSGALLNHRHRLTLNDRCMVRPGITLYGLSPSPETDQALREGFKPAMRLVSRISHVHDVDADTTVSYSRRWRAERATTIATVQAGYADGVPRSLTNRGFVGVGGRLLPVAGTVCMDALMVDAGTISAGETDPVRTEAVRIGDEAVLFGTGGPSCFEVARAAGTITYEITCRVSSRVQRTYTTTEADL